MKQEQTYEQAINRLEELVTKLEEETLPLEEAMQLFEEGAKLAAFCKQYLDQAQIKVEEIAAADAI